MNFVKVLDFTGFLSRFCGVLWKFHKVSLHLAVEIFKVHGDTEWIPIIISRI